MTDGPETPRLSTIESFQGCMMTLFPRRKLHRPDRLTQGVAAAIAALTPATVQANTTSHAYTAAGEAQNPIGGFSCKTANSDPVVANAFTSSMGVPIEGLAFCNLSGSLVDNVAAGATSAASTASRAFNGGQADLTAASVAAYDHIGAQASATFTGYTSGTAYHSAEGAAIIGDTLTYLGGTGTGYATYGFTIDGSPNAASNSEAQIYLAFTAAGNSPQFAFVARLGNGVPSVFAPFTTGFTGFTSDATSITGSGRAYTYGVGFTFSTPTNFEYGLQAYAYAGAFIGEAATNFIGTARLTSITVRDSLGNIVDFSATSASGTLYDSMGAHVSPVAGAVPEPASWLMMLTGFALLGWTMRRHNAAMRAQPFGA